MKAMILAAGLGRRLRPVTLTIPKALVTVNGKPLLQHALEHIRQHGICEVIINLHHFPGQIMDFLAGNGNFGLQISFSDESDQLLETGGGVKKASWFFDGGVPFLVRNVDVLSTLDIGRMELSHRDSGAVATLAVRDRETSRYLLFDRDLTLCGWENRSAGEVRLSRKGQDIRRLAFSGIQILRPEIFGLITETGSFSLTDLYLRLAATHVIRGYVDTSSVWRDAGSRTREADGPGERNTSVK